MKCVPATKLFFGCLWAVWGFLLYLFDACFLFFVSSLRLAGSDGFLVSGGCNPLTVCALVCHSVFCKVIAQSFYGWPSLSFEIKLT